MLHQIASICETANPEVGMESPEVQIFGVFDTFQEAFYAVFEQAIRESDPAYPYEEDCKGDPSKIKWYYSDIYDTWIPSGFVIDPVDVEEGERVRAWLVECKDSDCPY